MSDWFDSGVENLIKLGGIIWLMSLIGYGYKHLFGTGAQERALSRITSPK